MNIVERYNWGHINGSPLAPIRTPTPRLWLHHGAAGSSTVDTARSYLRHHIVVNGWRDIGYSFLIADGQVLEGRGAGYAGAHTRGDNQRSHGICMVGDYQSRTPAPQDIAALVDLIVHGHEQGWWPGQLTGGHRDAPGATTLCPGDSLHRLIPTINRRALDLIAPPQEVDAMTPEQARKLDEVHAALLHDRNIMDDLRRLRLGVRAIAAKLGIPTAYDAPDQVES